MKRTAVISLVLIFSMVRNNHAMNEKETIQAIYNILENDKSYPIRDFKSDWIKSFCKNETGKTHLKNDCTEALIWAVQKNKKEEVDFLIENKTADINGRKIDSEYPFNKKTGGTVEKIIHFKDKGGYVKSIGLDFGTAPIIEASKNGHLEIAKKLLENGAIPYDKASIEAIKNDKSEILETLLNMGANLNVDGKIGANSLRLNISYSTGYKYSLFLFALHKNNLKIAQMLIDRYKKNPELYGGRSPIIQYTHFMGSNHLGYAIKNCNSFMGLKCREQDKEEIHEANEKLKTIDFILENTSPSRDEISEAIDNCQRWGRYEVKDRLKKYQSERVEKQ